MKKANKTTSKTRIMIADDHAIVREGLAMILDIQPDFTVVAQAKDGQEAVELARTHRPDVAILDLMMPILDGCQAALEIKKTCPQTSILILTSFIDSAKIAEAIQNGVAGVVGKESPREDLLSAIRTVASGGRAISSEARHALDESNDIPPLSPRQREVLESISRGLTNDNIARQYKLSKSAVKFHLLELYRKLKVSNRAEAVAIAMRKHLLKI